MNYSEVATYLNTSESRIVEVAQLLGFGQELDDRQISFIEKLLAFMVENSITDVQEALNQLSEKINSSRYGVQQEGEADRRLMEDAIARRYTALKVGSNLGLAAAIENGIVDDWLNREQRGAIAASERVLKDAFTKAMQSDDAYLLELAQGKHQIQWSFTRQRSDLLLGAALDN